MSDYVQADHTSHAWKLNMSHLKFSEVGNLVTTAYKEIDMDADCRCVRGSIGPVDKVVLSFDYSAELGAKESTSGSANITLYDLTLEYSVSPEVIQVASDYLSDSQEGALHLKVNRVNLSAEDYPVRIFAEQKQDEVKAAFEAFFYRFLTPDQALDST